MQAFCHFAIGWVHACQMGWRGSLALLGKLAGGREGRGVWWVGLHCRMRGLKMSGYCSPCPSCPWTACWHRVQPMKG